MKHYKVKIHLYGIEPEIWRSFTVPADYSMAQFHHVIQQAMGWENQYDHEFRYGKGKNLRDIIAPPHPERYKGADSFTDEAGITIAQFVGRSKLPKRFLYLYDYADEWIHEIAIEELLESDDTEPKMIDGARACPPEACGGTHEYLSICAGECDWFDEEWDAEAFDISKISFAQKAKKKKK